jgi:soluble lytic murein transglycosylase-like protein
VSLAASTAAHAEPIAHDSAEPVPVPVARAAPSADPTVGSGTGASATRRSAAGRPYWKTLEREARKHGLPPEVPDAVAAIESGYDPSAIGSVGEIGLMQVRPSTAAMLGFAGDAAELARPEVNIRYGVAYLAQAWRLANGDLCRALMKYRAGHAAEVMSPLSVRYCSRARAHLAAVGSPLADGASVPRGTDPVVPGVRAARRGPRSRTASVSAAFWAKHEARVRVVTAKVHATWRRLASR